MNLAPKLAGIALSFILGHAHAGLVDLRVTRGTPSPLNPQSHDELRFLFDDSAGATTVPLSTFASSFGVVSGYAGTLASRDHGYASTAYIGFTAGGTFMIYEPCGPLLPSPATQCYVLSITPTNGLSTATDPRIENGLGGYLDEYLSQLLLSPNAGLQTAYFNPPNFNQPSWNLDTSRVWALDVVAPNSVPEPGSYALAMLAMGAAVTVTVARRMAAA